MVQTLLKTCKVRLLFSQKSIRNPSETIKKRGSNIDLEIDTIFYRFFTDFGALLGPLGASLGTIFPPKCCGCAGPKRFWTRFGDFCMAFPPSGASGTTLGTILSPFGGHFRRILVTF